MVAWRLVERRMITKVHEEIFKSDENVILTMVILKFFKLNILNMYNLFYFNTFFKKGNGICGNGQIPLRNDNFETVSTIYKTLVQQKVIYLGI